MPATRRDVISSSASTALQDLAGHPETRDEGQLGLDLVPTLDHRDVGEVNPGGLHADAHLGGDLSASEEMASTVDRALIKNCTFSKPIIAANSPSAVQAVKHQIKATTAEHALSREALEQELGDRVRAGNDFSEGVAAFLDKRRPNYG